MAEKLKIRTTEKLRFFAGDDAAGTGNEAGFAADLVAIRPESIAVLDRALRLANAFM
jgi:hypothetical protein